MKPTSELRFVGLYLQIRKLVGFPDKEKDDKLMALRIKKTSWSIEDKEKGGSVWRKL